MTYTALAVLGAALLAASLRAAPDSIGEGLRRAADRILQHQAADGAITQIPADSPENTVLPYFANFAGIGLADAARVTGDSRYLDGARRWAAWYEAHLNPNDTIYDYTGHAGAWKSTGHYDSTDSYASTYMELILAIHRARPDAPWLKARAPYLRRTLAAIRLTLQPNGLTKAHPTWDFMYTMDNVEVAKGLRALETLARTLKDRDLAAEAGAMAAKTVAALNSDLWDTSRQCYLVGIMSNGAKAEGLEKWYPDVMANLMAIGWLPPTERSRELYTRLHARFGAQIPAAAASEDDLDRLVWWAWAARGAGDHKTLDHLIAELAQADRSIPRFANVAYPGHICRLLAASLVSARAGRARSE